EEQLIYTLTINQSTREIKDIVTAQTVKTEAKVESILKDVNKGNTVLFVEGHPECFLLETANIQGRSIGKPENEITLVGPKESFIEKALTNISLIRKKIRNENLIVENMQVSKRSTDEVYILYLNHLVNKDLLKKVKKRLQAIDTDAIQNSSKLQQYIEDRPKSFFPTILYTERPDRAASLLMDGYIVVVMDNSPACLVMPATFWLFFHNPEEHYLRFVYGNFTRFLRMMALFTTIFTSAIYVAITNYHVEMIPPDLLMAISATREKVPFPVIIEIFIMEVAFELIREAGLRVPSPIGPTIGIVGALILGQAAVEANLISPIVIIIVALGGLSSFAINDINLNYTIRLIKFLFISAAGFLGVYTLTAIFIMGIFYLVTIKSFGVPYLAPMTPKFISSKDTIVRKVITSTYWRPGYLKTKDLIKHQEQGTEK
ncbi:MAG TPA: spore germination protein, partial [Chondromyces sp.]|nr:spore germination protein [Chondromyces sp.]